ncbi:hypothetical protein Scep_012652 [Stephania cephalantha]|uniref:DUF1664 domain-containing protein n=1 Tax=Stephania cephalantha TaxID=152367 RepID=A0AAP0JFH6_9MAGN
MAMPMMQSGVASSKVLILLGAGLTGSVILRSGRLSDVIIQLQELMKGVNEADISTGKYDGALIAAQIRQLAQEIRELAMSRPVTILNGNSNNSGKCNLVSYLLPAAAVGAMGYCYLWWKGWSFSDIMFVTKQNMANAVTNVSKQLEQVSTVLAATKRHLSQRLANLDGKLDEQKETSNLIMNDVTGMKSNLSQIGVDLEMIQNMVFGLEGKLEALESKQDITNSGLWYLCQYAEGIKDGFNSKTIQDISSDNSMMTLEDNSLKGLQFIADSCESGNAEKLEMSTMVKSSELNEKLSKINVTAKSRIHRAHTVGLSSIMDIKRLE